MSPTIRAHLSLTAATLLFSANYWIAKGMMPEMFTSLQIVSIRLIGSVIIFWILYMFLPKQKVSPRDMFRLFLAGFLGVSVNQVMFFEGLNLTDPVNVSIIHVLNPIAIMVFAMIIIHERITKTKLAGIFLGTVGAGILVIWGNTFSINDDNLLGSLFILINTLAYSVYVVIVKPLMKKYSASTIMAWVFLFGALMVLPFSGSDLADIQWFDLTADAWISVGYVVICTTILAYFLTTYSLKHLSATAVGFYVYFQPILVTIAGIIIFNEGLSLIKVISALLIFAGVFLVNLKVKANGGMVQERPRKIYE